MENRDRMEKLWPPRPFSTVLVLASPSILFSILSSPEKERRREEEIKKGEKGPRCRRELFIPVLSHEEKGREEGKKGRKGYGS